MGRARLDVLGVSALLVCVSEEWYWALSYGRSASWGWIAPLPPWPTKHTSRQRSRRFCCARSGRLN